MSLRDSGAGTGEPQSSPWPRNSLLVIMLVLSLVPAMSAGKDPLRYLPVFIAIFLTGLYSLGSLRDGIVRDRLKTFSMDNLSVLTAGVLYIAVLAVAALRSGTGSDLLMVCGIGFVLVVIHFSLPVFVYRVSDLVFVMKSLLFICLFCCLAALILLCLWFFGDVELGVYPAYLLSDKSELLQRFGVSFVARGIFFHPNFLGTLIAFVLPSALFLIKQERSPKHRALYYLCLIVMLLSLISSAALISLVPVLAVLLSFRSLRRESFFNLLRLLIAAGIVLSNVIVIAGINPEILGRLPVTSKGRVEIWGEAIRIIRENPVYGVGPSQTSQLLPQGLASHNTFIETALGGGMAAMVLYSIYLLLVVSRVRFSGDRETALYALLTFLTFAILQTFETLVFGGFSITNFYFLVICVSYLSVSSCRRCLQSEEDLYVKN